MYRLTLDNGLSAPLTEDSFLHLMRQAKRRRDEITRVPRGFVVTTGGRMAALLKVG